MNVRALKPYILTTSDFLMERAIKQNHKPTANPPSTVIVATDNHSLPRFSSLELVPSPITLEKQWDRYLSFLKERIISSDQEHDANAYVDILFVLGRHIIRTEEHTEEGGVEAKDIG